jgi:UDPglucose 6-dehydrogenase
MKIAMIGSGYVGLVSGACFADFGHTVVCIDKAEAKIDALNRGEIPIFEPGLDALVAENVKAGRLSFTTEFADPVGEADVVFIAVGTPSRRGDGHADLSYVYAAAREIAAAVTGFTVVVTKSTVPVGTGDEVERIMRETRTEADSPSSRTRNSCARVRRSAISSGRTASSSASRTSAGART